MIIRDLHGPGKESSCADARFLCASAGKQQAKRLGQPYNEESTPDESDEEEDASNGSVDEYGDAGQIVIDGSDEGENVKVIGLDEEEDFIDDDSEIDEKYDDRLLPGRFIFRVMSSRSRCAQSSLPTHPNSPISDVFSSRPGTPFQGHLPILYPPRCHWPNLYRRIRIQLLQDRTRSFPASVPGDERLVDHLERMETGVQEESGGLARVYHRAFGRGGHGMRCVSSVGKDEQV